MSEKTHQDTQNGFEEIPNGQAQRQRAIRLIALCACGISFLYTLSYSLFNLIPLAIFNGVFAVLYAVIATLTKPATTRSLGIILMGFGTVQLAGMSLLFLPPDTGAHFYLMVVPIFSLIAIHPRDRFWWGFLSLVALILIAWLEWNRDTLIPAFAGKLTDHDYSAWRATAAFLTVALSFGVFRAFHRDLHQARKELHRAYERSETLLRNMLPLSIAKRLKKEQRTIADAFEDASVLFADLVGFTALAAKQPADETVKMLNSIFSAFDQEVSKRKLEKIKTIGDAYMVAGGLPNPQPDHATRLLSLAIEMLEIVRRHNEEHGYELRLRIGLCTGPLIAGVIGNRKLSYDVWGDTVNVASRMESTGIPGRIQVTEGVVEATDSNYEFEERGLIDVKGRGEMRTYLVVDDEEG